MDTELKSLNQNQNQNENENHPKQYQQEPIDNGDLPLLKSDSSPSDYQRTNQIPEEKHFTAEEFEDIEKKFAAYVRHDIYGPMGRGQLPMAEKFLLFLAMFTLLPLRIFIGMSILVFYYIICRICTLFSSPYRLDEGDDPQQQQQQQHEDYSHLGGWRRQIIVCCGRFLSRALLFTLGFYWISQTSRIQSDSRDQLENSERPGVVISNHISYLDILYHMSTSFPSFVAKRSVGKLPLVGLISKCLGCVYVQREDKSSDFKGVSGVVTERIKEAHDISDAPLMLIFPGKAYGWPLWMHCITPSPDTHLILKIEVKAAFFDLSEFLASSCHLMRTSKEERGQLQMGTFFFLSKLVLSLQELLFFL